MPIGSSVPKVRITYASTSAAGTLQNATCDAPARRRGDYFLFFFGFFGAGFFATEDVVLVARLEVFALGFGGAAFAATFAGTGFGGGAGCGATFRACSARKYLPKNTRIGVK